MNETLRNELTSLFEEAKKAHGVAFAHTDGEDPVWPQWYASYLINKIGPVLGTWLSHEELTELIIEMENARQISGEEKWAVFYSDFILNRYAQPGE